MLKLEKITKVYYIGEQIFGALDGIDLEFKKNEFVSILGPSGSGKTTLLNIIGGLDQYSSGDVLLDGKSTKDFRDKDWDGYRNTSVGFVFQNYNLISHLSVLDNVEIALSLSGVNATERKKRAKQVLKEVGLFDHIHKKPNQLSGGQMQRVAIARALVNDPEILLADEPTGALDTKTSKQIMKLIQSISQDRLVIMVTHNKEIATTYSDRIVELRDGLVIKDTRSFVSEDEITIEGLSKNRTSMSYLQAMKTSLKNLLTKKGRTMITALAGSIGIIGIAMVLAISYGMNSYVSDVQSDTLSGFPLTIDQYVATDSFGPPQGNPMNEQDDATLIDEDVVYSYDAQETTTLHTNTIDEDFLAYMEELDPSLYNSISYTNEISINLLTETSNGTIELVDSTSSNGFFGSSNSFQELLANEAFMLTQYDVLSGTYPSSYEEIVLVVDEQNRVDASILESYGFSIEDSYTFDDFLGKTLQVTPNNVFYHEVNGVYLPNTDLASIYDQEENITLEIVGIMRLSEDASSELIDPGVAYLPALTEHMLNEERNSDVVLAQMNSEDINVLTGQPFNAIVGYDDIIKQLGGDDSPSGIQIYPVSFDAKEDIKSYIDLYNEGKTEEESIVYTDLAEQISSTISGLINTITIILTAFAAISLVVSSIMIGIITYVSVIERTKEIGIMRSLGARKKDISRIFNAETILVGLTAGTLGVLLAYLLILPVNLVISNLIDIDGFSTLPISYSVLLILLSTSLTLISGLIPSRIASRKDPVIALRTE